MAKAVQLVDKNNNKCYPAPYWPIGSIYISVVNTNPSQWFGGTWVAFGTGRCLVGVDTSQTEFNRVMKTGGEKTHKLTINEMPGHNHSTPTTLRYEITSSWWIGGTGGTTIAVDNKPTGSTGGDKSHNNLQPYITVYMWRRTA